VESNVAKTWMEQLARTANAKDVDAHMELISRRVQVFGMPGIDVIDYDGWKAQCQYEFEQGILKRYSYEGIDVVMMMPGKVVFDTRETVEATDGTVHVMDVEIALAKEEDGQWRVIQENVKRIDSR
jgi:ketosteroid isomerase-like protein